MTAPTLFPDLPSQSAPRTVRAGEHELRVCEMCDGEGGWWHHTAADGSWKQWCPTCQSRGMRLVRVEERDDV